MVDSLNMDITEINTLNQEGVENLQATLRACVIRRYTEARRRITASGYSYMDSSRFASVCLDFNA